MARRITELRIHLEQSLSSDAWIACFHAEWDDGSTSMWDVKFAGPALWVTGDMTDDVWISAVLRAATDGHQPVESTPPTQRTEGQQAASDLCDALDALSMPSPPMADGSRAESLFAQSEQTAGDVSRETNA